MKISPNHGEITDFGDLRENLVNIQNPKEILGIWEDVSLRLNLARLGC